MAGQPATKCCCDGCGPCNIPKTSKIVMTITSVFEEDGTFCACGNGIEIEMEWDEAGGYFEGVASFCGSDEITFRFYCFSFQPGGDYEVRMSPDFDDIDTVGFDTLWWEAEYYTCDPFVTSSTFWFHGGLFFHTCNTALVTITEVPA